MYVLAKFQLRILKAVEVTALQISSNRKIDLYRENKLQALPKTDVTYERSEVVHTDLNFPPSCRNELRNGLLGKLFLQLIFITTNKVEIHEDTSIANNRFNVT